MQYVLQLMTADDEGETLFYAGGFTNATNLCDAYKYETEASAKRVVAETKKYTKHEWEVVTLLRACAYVAIDIRQQYSEDAIGGYFEISTGVSEDAAIQTMAESFGFTYEQVDEEASKLEHEWMANDAVDPQDAYHDAAIVACNRDVDDALYEAAQNDDDANIMFDQAEFGEVVEAWADENQSTDHWDEVYADICHESENPSDSLEQAWDEGLRREYGFPHQ